MNIVVGTKYKNTYGDVVTVDAIGTDHVMVIGRGHAVFAVSKATLSHVWTEVREPERRKVFLYAYHSEPGSWCVQAGADGTPYDYKQDDIKIAGSAWITEGQWAEFDDNPANEIPF